MRNKSLIPDLPVAIRLFASILFWAISGVILVHFYLPYVILAAFFLFQVLVKCGTLHHQNETEEMPFQEAVLIGPAKILTSIIMVASGIPDGGFGLFWIGLALLVGGSGVKNLHFVFRSIQSKPAAAGKVSALTVVTARQREKELNAEEHLFSDLADFLANATDKKE